MATAATATIGQKTSWAPTAKVSVGVLAAAIVTLLMPWLKQWMGSDPAPAGAALTTVVTFVIQYLVPERK